MSDATAVPDWAMPVELTEDEQALWSLGMDDDEASARIDYVRADDEEAEQ